MNTELIESVKHQFNLNIYETKVWLALLEKGIASAGEIAKISGIPRSRTYDVLESLEKSGFAISKIGKPIKYIAVKPTLVIEKLKKDEQKKTEDKLKILSSIKTSPEYQELEGLYNSATELVNKYDYSGTIAGKTNINSHISGLIDSAEKEILICTPISALNEKSRLFSNLFKKLSKTGIKFNIALNGTPEEIKKINEKYGIKAKKIDVNSFFVVKDNSEILFMLDEKTGNDETAIWLNSDFFVSAFSHMFKNSVK